MRKLIVKEKGKYGYCEYCGKYTQLGKFIIKDSKTIKRFVCFDCFASKFMGFLKEKGDVKK